MKGRVAATAIVCMLYAGSACAATFIAPPSGYRVEQRFPATTALSPDGSRVAFLVNRGDVWIAVASVRALRDARVLPSTRGANGPFWSPDGKRIAFFQNGELRTIALNEHGSRLICKCEGRHGSWGKDGTILYSPSRSGAIQAIDARGCGPARAVTTVEQGHWESHEQPELLPDGKRFLFAVTRSTPGKANPELYPRIYLSDLQGRSRRLLVADADAAAPLDGETLVFRRRNMLFRLPFEGGAPTLIAYDCGSFHSNGRGGLVRTSLLSLTELVWLDRSGKFAGRLTGQGSYNRPRISPDGKFAAYDEGPLMKASGVVIREIATRKVVRSFPAGQTGVAWSSDSRHIAAPLLVDGKCTIAIATVTSGAIESLATACNTLFDWSPDGVTIAIRKQEGERESFDLLPAGPNGTVDENAPDSFNQQGWLRFAPGGDLISFDARQVPNFSPSLGYEAYIGSRTGPLDIRQLTFNGGNRPAWRADGRELFYIAGERRLIVTEPPDCLTRTHLFDLPPSSSVLAEYDVAPDGSRFLVSRAVDGLLYVRFNGKN